jgi:hypothetical protein
MHHKPGGETGCGHTLNMSSRGVLFTTEAALPEDRLVEISVDCLVKLEGVCALKLVAVGRVVRTEPRCAAMRIERYEFKTRRAA